ncbi:helix-turn-helix domain-containing protein [Nocardiopsis mangrovi]|uniref:Helix-turn-helix domain-containing protein n=1 Tax=Nocardiopsis mangrovi TaxID=1179818 RepID=A0ABV9E1L9_9ACTN
MSVSTFNSADFPRKERFDRWHQWWAEGYAPVDADSDHAGDFEFSHWNLTLGAVAVSRVAYRSVGMRRTPALVRSSDAEVYHLGLVMSGRFTSDGSGSQKRYLPGEIHTSISSRAADCYCHSDGRDLYRQIGITAPRDSIGLPAKLVAEAAAIPISHRQGVGAVLGGFVTHIAANADTLTPTDAARLGTVLADLVSVVLARALEADTALTPEARRRGLLLRAQAFFLENLHDPGLGPEDGAAHLHISVRHLHQLFGPTGTTAAAWIRRQRLDRARRDLADPALADLPVSAIARRWGYTHSTTFGRAFRAAYDTSPTDHRHQVRHRPDR